MRRVSRIVPALALGLILGLALSGCIHEDRSVALNGDGSGTYTLALGLSDQLLSLGGDQISTSMDQVGAQVKQEGGSYTKHDDGSYTVWTFSRPFKNIAELNTLLQRPLTTGQASPSASTDSFHVSQTSGLFTNSFHVTGHMSMMPAGGQPPGTTTGEVAQMLKDMRESFAVSMPGWISAHSGGSVSGSTIAYTIHYGQQTSIDVTSSALSGGGVASLAGGMLFLIAAGALALALVLRRRAAGAATMARVPVSAVVPPIPTEPFSPLSAPAYASDTPTIPSPFRAPDASSSAIMMDQPPSSAVSPDTPTEQG